ncbi:hypothetical protein [Bacillus testis]|uniref:hypothetical protein n=1 Tax=Bacillus testis TaxID=1622072 RepID=UPI00067F006D|nr:hypothetical protein [Bacillus testis]
MAAFGLLSFMAGLTLFLLFLMGTVYYALAYPIAKQKKKRLLSGVAMILLGSPILSFAVHQLYMRVLYNSYKYKEAGMASLIVLFLCLAIGIFLLASGMFSKRKKAS